MNPQKVHREHVAKLEDLPNIGKAMAADLRGIGIVAPAQLAGRDAYQLYEALCRKTGVRQDPCVIDTFLSIVFFMDGGEALPWWAFTQQRKRHLVQLGGT
ncbi:MAG: helix-hairpin-helix domain-containing protein [Sideroxydans sp.]|nr:helix-hairpin-helix domain-containing protein [Sideroxydans sp.]